MGQWLHRGVFSVLRRKNCIRTQTGVEVTKLQARKFGPRTKSTAVGLAAGTHSRWHIGCVLA